MHYLYNDALAPITSEIGFIEVDHVVAARAFLEWNLPIMRSRGVSLSVHSVSGNLHCTLLKLLPLTSVERRRYLFVPTASGWTAFFDNGHQGTDAFSVMSYLAQQLRCRGLRVVATRDTIKNRVGSERHIYRAAMLEVYGPEKTDFLNYIRSIAVAYDGDRWVFDQAGTPFPFEDITRYTSRNIKERFDTELLSHYLEHLGVSAFDESFYLPSPDSTAELVEKHGPTAPGLVESGLAC